LNDRIIPPDGIEPGDSDSPHHTHRESNPAHFFAKPARPKIPPRRGFAQPAISELLPKAPPCPFSVQPGGKLMQEIHRLTDN
jgi:hypothetical protein